MHASSRNLEAVESLADRRKSFITSFLWLATSGLALLCVLASVEKACAEIVNGDPLEAAITAPNDSINFKENSFEVFAADAITYDDNIYRLAPDVTSLKALAGIGPYATRYDYTDTITLGLDGGWTRGRQALTADFRVDDNRFFHNTNLDNFSYNDKLTWNWNVGSVLSGELGASYNSGLVSFVNSTDYARNIYAVTTYYGAGRYQPGPRWAIFGGVLESGTTLSEASLRSNDLHTKSVEFGSELTTGQKDSLGLEYRYTDARYPLGTTVNGDYREDAGRIVVRHEFSEKTKIDANMGFLKRDYASVAITSFSGDVWRIAAQWQPTDKVQFELDGWRNLQAYVTSQSDYFVSKGGRIAPQWAASAKITIMTSVGYEAQDYIGVGQSGRSQGSRRDTLATSQARIKYTPFKFLVFDFGYAYEKRSSTAPRFRYNDKLLNVRFTVKL